MDGNEVFFAVKMAAEMFKGEDLEDVKRHPVKLLRSSSELSEVFEEIIGRKKKKIERLMNSLKHENGTIVFWN